MSLTSKVYLDHAAGTPLDPLAAKSVSVSFELGNPSATYATDARTIMSRYRNLICKYLGVTLWEPGTSSNGTHTILYTSGGTESNASVLRMVVDGYRRLDPNVKTRPHIVVSAVEHHSLILAAKSLASCGYADVTIASCDKYGFVNPLTVSSALRPDTVLVCVIHGSNETGGINDIPGILKVCHEKGVPVHVDCVQTFGKMSLPSDCDSMSFSSHKFGGLSGAGGLVLSRDFVDGYELMSTPLIAGSQNYGLRGGTENISGIYTGYISLEHNLREKVTNRSVVVELRKYLIDSLRKHVPCRWLSEYWEAHASSERSGIPMTGKPFEIVFLVDASRSSSYLPGIVLLSVTKWTSSGVEVCNGNIKKELLTRGYIVSVGSACNTKSALSSHVVTSMGIPPAMRKGVLRISLSHTNTKQQLDGFVKEFIDIISKYR